MVAPRAAEFGGDEHRQQAVRPHGLDGLGGEAGLAVHVVGGRAGHLFADRAASPRRVAGGTSTAVIRRSADRGPQ